jgi:hypothetical protein
MSKNPDLTRNDLIALIQDVASRLQKDKVSRSEFIRETGISEWHVSKHFESWNDLVESAGLTPTVTTRIEDDDLFSAMYTTFMKHGGVSTRTKFGKLCEFSSDVYKRRWGRWKNVLLQFRLWLERYERDFPYLEELPQIENNPNVKKLTVDSAEHKQTYAWSTSNQLQYGPLLNFRGLQHAPINEQGVVFVFGMIAFELGFVVESVAAGFPDCEAKRRVGKERWERVSIEFEYKSKNFHAHGHDPSQCDLIICWIDDWDECPLEVIELKSAIDDLSN